jgi:hypothetical protein
VGDRRRGPGQKEELCRPGGAQGVLRRVTEDGHGNLPEVPCQGAGAAAVGGGRALEPAVRRPGAGRLGRGHPEQRRVPAGFVVFQGHQVVSVELEQMLRFQSCATYLGPHTLLSAARFVGPVASGCI